MNLLLKSSWVSSLKLTCVIELYILPNIKVITIKLPGECDIYLLLSFVYMSIASTVFITLLFLHCRYYKMPEAHFSLGMSSASFLARFRWFEIRPIWANSSLIMHVRHSKSSYTGANIEINICIHALHRVSMQECTSSCKYSARRVY